MMMFNDHRLSGVIFAGRGRLSPPSRIELGLIRADFLRVSRNLTFHSTVQGHLQRPAAHAIPFFTHVRAHSLTGASWPRTCWKASPLFGPVRRAGCPNAVILVGVLWAPSTALSRALGIAMGIISLPVMMRYGYSKSATHRRDCG